MDIVGELPPDLARLIFSLGSATLVLVEGNSDRDIFDIWFRERLGEVFFFTPAVPEGATGVRAILNRVIARFPGIRAFGIIDRDFRSDAEVEGALSDSATRLFPLRRFCIENYLLEPDALFGQISLLPRDLRRLDSRKAAETALLDLCQRLHTMIAANLELHERGGRYFPSGHDLVDRDTLIQQAARRLGLDITAAEQRIQEKEEQIAPLLAVLETAYTIISGKHLLFHVHVIYFKGHVSREHLCNLLADRIRETPGLHPDIRAIVEDRILNSP